MPWPGPDRLAIGWLSGKNNIEIALGACGLCRHARGRNGSIRLLHDLRPTRVVYSRGKSLSLPSDAAPSNGQQQHRSEIPKHTNSHIHTDLADWPVKTITVGRAFGAFGMGMGFEYWEYSLHMLRSNNQRARTSSSAVSSTRAASANTQQPNRKSKDQADACDTILDLEYTRAERKR